MLQPSLVPGGYLQDDGTDNIIQILVRDIHLRVIDTTVGEHIRYLLVQTAQAFRRKLPFALINFLVVACEPKCKVNPPTVKGEEPVVDSVL